MKWNWINLFFTLVFTLQLNAQYQWTWTPMANMPIRTANNAVVATNSLTGQSYLYSFGGIDSTKSAAGIHQRVFGMNFLSNSWMEYPSLPDTLGKIAMGASYVNGKIYVMGGYHVLPNGNEISSDRVHVYNPNLNVFEADAANIPLAIDDHVQCVYKDSLIFVVTGWSNNGNKPNVQIFNPSSNAWSVGTSVPNSAVYTSFGSSGYIVGDTLYYFGGASGGGFVARDFMRKGYINPADPTDITWSTMTAAPGGAGYRTACAAYGEHVFWVGGSSVAYNYDGIAYNGSGGVQPQNRILHLKTSTNEYQNNDSEAFGVMDLRGIGELIGGRYLICGGMDSNQVVTNRTFLLSNPTLSLEEEYPSTIKISYSTAGVSLISEAITNIVLFSSEGKKVAEMNNTQMVIFKNEDFVPGVYFVKAENFSQKLIIR